MQALVVLGLALFSSALWAARVEWNAPLKDCAPADLAVSAEGQSYVACQLAYGQAAIVYSYGFSGLLMDMQIFTADLQESLLPRDLLLHEGILYLSFTLQKPEVTHSQLVAMDAQTLKILWQHEQPEFMGSNLVALPTHGIWWVGVNDERDADILAFRYQSDGTQKASFQYDSGDNDGLGFDRRSAAAGPNSSLYIGGFAEVFRVKADGDLLWKADFPSTAITSCANGDLLATNLRAPKGNTARFSTEGQLLWQLDQGGSAIAITADQTIWLAGTDLTHATANWDLRMLQISDSGSLLQLDTYQGPFQDRAVDLATDSLGNAYILASSFVKSGWFGTADRYLILKYDHQGRRLWSHLYGVTGWPEALHVTPEGDIYAVGADGTIFLRE
jgi:hypothetical protein